MCVFLRTLCSPQTAKPFFTYQQIAEAFGYADRRNIQNFMAEFHGSEENFEHFLSRTNTKHETSFPLIEEQVLECPFLTLHQQYRAFLEAHPDEKVSEKTFRQYVHEIDGSKILKRVQQLVSDDKAALDVSRYLQEVLEVEELQSAKKKEIVECFPDVKTSCSASKRGDSVDLSGSSRQQQLLVVLLYVSNVSQEMRSLVFGVGKTSIHKYIYAVCGEDLDWRILREIVCWSGKVSVDEKWVKIKGPWHYVLCAVDAVSGFPLLVDLDASLDTASWTVFFKRFKALYGVPMLIQCDGSQA